MEYLGAEQRLEAIDAVEILYRLKILTLLERESLLSDIEKKTGN